MRERIQNLQARKGEKGAALITVLVALMVITILLFEFQFSAMLERKMAYNDLNQSQAYYLAKSGANFGLLRLSLYGRLLNNQQIKSSFKAMGGNPQPFMDQLWQLPIPPFPPAAANLSSMDKADRDSAEKALKTTKVTDGQYSHVITSESGKINLNSLVVPRDKLEERPNFQVPPTRPDQYTAQLLMHLIDGIFKESDNPYEEYPDLVPEELVMDIMDWVNPGNNRFYGGIKDAWYERQDPPYKAKKNRFYSLEELRLVKGMTGKLFDKMRPHLTVYSEGSKINLNTATSKMYKIIYPDFTEDDLKRVIEKRDEIGGWPSESKFVEYVSDDLGRHGFRSMYNDAKAYPFSVDTDGFYIESIGSIRRSASAIQRVIRIGVALSGGVGGQLVPGITSQAECQKNTRYFWHTQFNQCRTKPTTKEECVGSGGSWLKNGADDVCKYNIDAATGPPLFITPPKLNPGEKVSPNALKVLYWSEV